MKKVFYRMRYIPFLLVLGAAAAVYYDQQVILTDGGSLDLFWRLRTVYYILLALFYGGLLGWYLFDYIRCKRSLQDFHSTLLPPRHDFLYAFIWFGVFLIFWWLDSHFDNIRTVRVMGSYRSGRRHTPAEHEAAMQHQYFINLFVVSSCVYIRALEPKPKDPT